MIVVRCLDSLEAAAPLRHEADALNCASARPDPFSTFAHYDSVCSDTASGAGEQGLWLLLASRGERLVGYLALRRRTRRVLGLRVRSVGFLADHDADRPHVVALAEDMQEVSAAFYHHLLGRCAEWSLLEFHQQDDASSLWPAPAGVDLGRHLVREWPSLENCTVPIRWSSLAGYFDALQKKFRTSLRRQLHDLLGAGRVELLASSDPAATPALLELYLAVEPRSWKSQAGIHLGGDARHRDRLRALLDPAQPMRISIQVLLLDGRPVAGLINGAYMQRLHALHIAHDERLARMAPGSAMLLLGMREAIEGGFACFNLLSGFGYFKSRWLAEIRETRVVQIYRRGSLPYWHRLAGDLGRRLFAAAARASPRVFNPARREAAERTRDSTAVPSTLDAERLAAAVRTARGAPGAHLAAEALRAVLPLRPRR